MTQIIVLFFSPRHVDEVALREQKAAMRKYFALYLATLAMLAMGLSAGATAGDQDARLPSLSDLMVITQLRQFKLWYSERADNWKLAAYQEGQLENTLRRIVALYPETASINQSKLIHDKIQPGLFGLRQSISDQNKKNFEAAYEQVTDACNECHRETGFGFIVVRVPKRSPFSNQEFEPTP